jgi:hypothetical protein
MGIISTSIKMSIVDTARMKVVIGIILSILLLVSYWGAAENQFIAFDDPLYVTENPQVDKGLDMEAITGRTSVCTCWVD